MAVVLVACTDSPTGIDVAEIGLSRAYSLWSPIGGDTCTRTIHDSYSVVGPDGFRYPTWHPPVDPGTGCTFGHEHGRDPRGSDLYAEVGPIPFAFANQQMDLGTFGSSRHEDHVGHKIEWENDIEMQIGGGGGTVLSIRCDVLTKMHQGSHSADAFTNNMHEIVYHIRCTDGTGFSVTMLTPIGNAGELTANCDRSRRIFVGTPKPPNSPDGGGRRAIPERSCIQQHLLGGGNSNFNSGLRESWETSNRIRTSSGKTLVSFNPYFQVLAPSRYYDPSLAGGVGRPIDLCYGDAETGQRAQGGLCQESTGNGSIPGVTWDDPRSAFNGAHRFVDINSNRVTNLDGPVVWYSDALGQNARTEPFPGSIRQWIARRDNSAIDLHGPQIGRTRNYSARGVHAPN